MNRIKNEGFSGLFLWLLITTALLYLSAYTPVTLVAVPFVFACVMVRFGWKPGLAVCLIGLAAVAISDTAAAAAFAAIALPAAATAAYVVRKKIRLFNSVLLTSGATLAGIAMVVGVIWLFTRLSVLDFAVNRLGGWLSQWNDDEINAFYQLVRSMDIFTGAITQEAVLATPSGEAIAVMQEMFHDWLNEALVSAMLIYSMLTGLLIYLITRSAAKRHGTEVCAVPNFGDYALPRWFWVGCVGSYLFSLIGENFGWPSFDLVINTISVVYIVVFIIQGLSFLDYIYRKRNFSPVMRRVLHALALLIISGLLMWVGLFENVIGIRKRWDEKGDADG